MGGVIAALFLFAIKKTIIFREDKIQASYRWVPIYVAVMAWAFSTYLVIKGLNQVWAGFISALNDLPLVALEAQSKPTFFYCHVNRHSDWCAGVLDYEKVTGG